MHGHERRAAIVDVTRKLGGYASINDLAALTGVSPLTIRRDSEQLEAAGLVRRTRGAIRLVEGQGVTLEPTFLARNTINDSAKRAIARAATALVRPGSTIAIDTGTTTLAFSQVLPPLDDLTIVTSSLLVATQTASAHEVHVLAGRVRPAELSVVGAEAYASALDRRLDQLFLGAAAVGEKVYDYSADDAYTKRALIGQANEVILLCDASKFGAHAAATVCELTTVTLLVTDHPPPAALARRLDDAGVAIHLIRNPEETPT